MVGVGSESTRMGLTGVIMPCGLFMRIMCVVQAQPVHLVWRMVCMDVRQAGQAPVTEPEQAAGCSDHPSHRQGFYARLVRGATGSGQRGSIGVLEWLREPDGAKDQPRSDKG